MQEVESLTKSPKSPVKRRKSVGKLSEEKSKDKTPKSPRSSAAGEEADATKSPKSRSRSRTRSKSPGKLKSLSKSSKSPGKSKSRRSSSRTRPTWWSLEHEEDEEEREARLQEEARRAQEEEERLKRGEDVRRLKDRNLDERNNSVQKGMVARLLAQQQKERPSKPVVLPNVRASPLKLDLSKFEAPHYKKDAEQKTLAKETAKNNFILRDLATQGAKTDIKKLVRAFESVEVKHGKKIVKQGAEGSHMYVIEKGTVDFKVDGVTVRTAGVGATFGEQNLLYQAAEKETVVANTEGDAPTRLLRLNQETFRGIMQTTEEHQKRPEPVEKVADRDSWLDNSEIMKERKIIRDALKKHVGRNDLEQVKVLGEGQFGEVWLATADLPGVPVPKGQERHEFALKCQNLSVKGMEKIIRGEIQAMEKLCHPFIGTLYHNYDSKTSIDMLLGLVPGGELWDVIHKENEETGEWLSGIPESHAQFYAFVVADTLSFIHGQQYIFRDLKPENILIDADGYPIIVDFGFAKHCPGKTFTFCGTPNYVAPEIIKNAGHDAAADWWALGIVIYEMISGENPFYFDDMEQMALFKAICDEDGEPLPKNFSKSVRDLVDQLLVKDQSKRLGSLKGKGQDVLNHAFFKGLDLNRIRAKKVRGPWIPGSENGSAGDYEAEMERERKRENEERIRCEQEEELLRLEKEEEERRKQRQEQQRLQREKEAEEVRRKEEAERQRQLKIAQEAERKRREEEQRLEEEERLKNAEEERKRLEEERLRLEEEERRRKAELERKRLEEEERLRLAEEERLRKEEEEQKRLEEERLRLAEEKRIRKAEEERKRLEEEERLRLVEEERLRKAEEERQRLAEEERLRKEEEERLAEQRRLEEERLQQEEEERRQLEEKQQQELKKKKEAAAKKQKEKEERKRLEEERLEKEREERQQRLALKKQKEAELQKLKEEEEEEERQRQARAEAELEKKHSAEDDELSMEDLLNDKKRPTRNTNMDESWNEAVSPASRPKRNVADLTSPVPKGIVAKLVNQRGQNGSPGSMMSPRRVQEELNKSVQKGLVASRLSSAREKEKMGSSVPSLFAAFEL